MKQDFQIRHLTKDDIKQMSNARKHQENENGNGATQEYIMWYEKVLEDLFAKKRLLATGAFKGEELVSLACFNLINFGSDKKIPYLCAVWTNPEFRGMGLSTQVNKQLLESLLEIKKELQPRALLTLEGNEAAYHLYKKMGYKEVSGEMTFLGDVQNVDLQGLECRDEQKDTVNKSETYFLHGMPIMEIVYSEEEFFAHPTNLDGRMNRIISITDMQGKASKKTLNLIMQQFFSKHRFCKMNVQELAQNDDRLYEIFGVKKGDLEGLLEGFGTLSFRNERKSNFKN